MAASAGSDWRHLPAAARPIAAAADAAVTAARDRDGEAMDAAVGDLAALDPAQVGLILGTTVRLLLEDQHPDGLTGDDIRAVLQSCVRGAAEWQPDVDRTWCWSCWPAPWACTTTASRRRNRTRWPGTPPCCSPTSWPTAAAGLPDRALGEIERPSSTTELRSA